MSLNDNFADRINLGSGTSAFDTGSNIGFTGEEGEPPQSGEINSAWWSWTPEQTGWVMIDDDEFNYISVFTGDAVDSLTLIVSQYNEAGFWATAGTEYHIAIDGLFDNTGEIQLNLEQDLDFILNDNFADRRDLGSGTSAVDTGSNIGFTEEEGEPSQSGEINSAWWSWTPEQTGPVEISTYGSSFNAYISVFTGDTVDHLNLVVDTDYYYDSHFLSLVFDYSVDFWAEAGIEYHIAIDGLLDENDFIMPTVTGEIQLSLEQDVSSIPNDNFIDRLDLGNETTISFSGSNLGYGSEEGEPSQWGAISSAWWTWTAPSNGMVTIKSTESDQDAYLSVFTGNAIDDLTLVARADYIYHPSGRPGFLIDDYVTFWATAGTEYQIAVDDVRETGDLQLTLEQDVANDTFANRIDLGDETPVSDTIWQEMDYISTAWWSWTAPETGWVEIDLEGYGIWESSLSVFTGDEVESLTLVANDNSEYLGNRIPSGIWTPVKVGFWATSGTEYQIKLDGDWYFEDPISYMSLNLNQDVTFIPNDDFADRRDLGNETSVSDTGSNIGFTEEGGEPKPEYYNQDLKGEINSAWWTWTASETGWVEIDTFDSYFDTYLSVFTGDAVDNLTLVAENNDAGYYNRSQVGFWATAGMEYQIAVDGNLFDTGKIKLNLEQTPAIVGNSEENTLIGGSDADTILGYGNDDRLEGGEGDDILFGGRGNDILLGEDGKDILRGGKGNDLYLVDGNDSVYDSGGNRDGVYGFINLNLNKYSGIENLTLLGKGNRHGFGDNNANKMIGNNGDNLLMGNDGEDQIKGENGNDTLIGGQGNDRLVGGDGLDSFQFNHPSEGTDRITDFNVVEDRIVIDSANFSSDLIANSILDSEQFTLGTSATTSEHRFIYYAPQGLLGFDADGVGDNPLVLIAKLSNRPADFTEGNISLI